MTDYYYFIEVKSIQHKTNHFKADTLVAFSLFTVYATSGVLSAWPGPSLWSPGTITVPRCWDIA